MPVSFRRNRIALEVIVALTNNHESTEFAPHARIRVGETASGKAATNETKPDMNAGIPYINPVAVRADPRQQEAVEG